MAVTRYFTAEDPEVARVWGERLYRAALGEPVFYEPLPPLAGWERRKRRLLAPWRRLRRQLSAAWEAFREARW